MTTTVVNVKRDSYDVYIGRFNSRYGLTPSIFRNPFKLNKDGRRSEVLEKFEDYFKTEYRDDSQYWNIQLDALRGKRLGCWCKPSACHGDLIGRLADMNRNERNAWAGLE
jgi:hypothetical protein